MLYRSVIQPDTLYLLNSIMSNENLRDFNLAEGTALAMQMGHRFSYYLDFFGKTTLSGHDLLMIISETYFFEEMHRTPQ